ncbi:ABC transporter ATP-binding protein [Oceaniglobus roseus]|uniref:ABC transporter ATP-binding protein n=1 Tax=Oceaniglobus roseus TaxID=1737570 RepID=UPI000C7EC750|nr:ABC transporter ATP-binding protein [Kandeliimicrobium roseum]
MAEPPVIVLERISRVYGTGEIAVRALDGIDLTVRAGEFIAIMGPSGSGKSTAMNVIGCLDTPSSGNYRFMGVEVAGLTRDQRALLRRHYIGFVFQGYNLLPRTSALQNVELPLIYRGRGRAERQKAALEALARVGLESRAAHDPGRLSGGQQQRVAIARALVGAPKIMLADEPTGNLDTRTSVEIMEMLRGLNREGGLTIVMVTHEPDMARYADRLIWMVDGRIARDEPTPGIA